MRREGVGGERRAEFNVVGLRAFALDEQISFRNRVGFRVDFLAVQINRSVFAALGRELAQAFFRDGQHAARAACAVIDEIRAGFKAVGNRQEDQIRHQAHDIAGREMFARLFVVFLVEAADQLLENRPHRVIIEAGQAFLPIAVQHRLGAEIDRRV